MAQFRQLEQHQARWRSLGIHDYQFDYWMTCCWFRAHVRYVVRADTVASTVVLDSLARPSPPLPITIDTVFAQGRAILANSELSLRVVYETNLPYPKVIGLLSPVGFDGDYTDSVSDFVRLR